MRPQIKYPIFPLVFALGFMCIYCDLSDSRQETLYTGITETIIEDGTIVILTSDPDDWQENYYPELPDGVQIWKNAVYPAVPNPARDSTTIRFSLNNASPVSFTIKNTSSQTVKTLVSSILSPGVYSFVWYLDDEEGRKVLPAIYRCYYDWRSEYESEEYKVSGHGDIKVE